MTEVGVGADEQAVDLDVVARVGDHRQVGADELLQARGELRPAGPAGENRYAQWSASGSPTIRIPACVL